MSFNVEDKVGECFHPELVNFNNKLSLLILFYPLRKVKHTDFKILNKVNMTVQVTKVVEVFSERGEYCMTNIDLRERFLINHVYLLLNLL